MKMPKEIRLKNMITRQDFNFFNLKPESLLGSFVSVFFLFSVWSIIYFAWTYVENNRRNVIERLKVESILF